MYETERYALSVHTYFWCTFNIGLFTLACVNIANYFETSEVVEIPIDKSLVLKTQVTLAMSLKALAQTFF